MAKFKNGDTVVVVNSKKQEYADKVGIVGKLINVGSEPTMYSVFFDDANFGVFFDEDQLELASADESDDTFSDYEKAFFFITDEMRKTFVAKNRDYGNSFSDTVRKFGLKVAVSRIHDKYMRLENMTLGKKMNVDESMRDALLDMANYCVLTVIELDRNNEHHE